MISLFRLFCFKISRVNLENKITSPPPPPHPTPPISPPHEIMIYPIKCQKRPIHSNKEANTESSHSQMFFKIVVLRNFAMFTEKPPALESHFNKACNFTEKRPQHRCFPVNIAKLLRTAFFYKTLPLTASVDMSLW